MLRKCLVLFLFVLLLANCSGVIEEGSPASTGSSAGSISLIVDTDDSVRSLSMEAIKYYDVTIKAMGMTPVVENGIPVSEISSRIFTIDAVNNVVVLVTPLDYSKNPVLSGIYLGGYGNVTAGERTTFTVSYQSAPMALILENLLNASFDVTTYDSTGLQAAIVHEITVNGVNPLAIDIETIASSVIADTTYAAVDAFPTATVTGSIVNPVGDTSGISVSINDPTIASVVSDASGNFTFTNVTWGDWRITLSSGGSTFVTVNNDGTYTPDPLEITAGVNTPIMYTYGISSFNDNGVQKTVVAAHANDIDGLLDIADVSIAMPAGHTPAAYVLADRGDSALYDTTVNDGIYEIIADEVFADGTYTLSITDQGNNTSSYSYDAALTYIDCPVVTSLSDGEVLNTTVPSISWNYVSGANNYNLVIMSGTTEVYAARDLNGLSHQVSELPEGNYTLHLYAYSNGSGYTKNFSMTSVSFSISLAAPQGTGEFAIDIGTSHHIVYNKGSNLYKLTTDTKSASLIYTGMGNVVLHCFSPDGLNILFTEDGSLYRMDINGGSPFLLVSYYGQDGSEWEVDNVVWSPDGQKIAYYQFNKVHVIDSDGSNKTMIDEYAGDIDFSGDSSRVYYRRSSAIYSNNLSGTDRQTVLEPGHTVSSLSISPDRNKLMYSYSTMNGYMYCSVNVDGSGNTEVYEWYSYIPPTWTLDNRFLFKKDAKVLMVTDGVTETDIPVAIPGSSIWFAEFTPTNDAIIIHDYYETGLGICDPDGSNYRLLKDLNDYTTEYIIISPQIW